MTATLLPNAKQQFLDSNGRPLAGGQVYFYIPNTSTLKNTWQDAGKTVLNTNPVVLDANGQAIIYGEGQYRQVVNDVHGNLIWDRLTDSPALNSEFQSFVSSITTSPGSSLIGFIQAGAGAVARTVQSRLRESVMASDFGAVGDGVTDDTTALLAAIAYGKLTNKRVDLVDGSTYITRAPLYLDDSGALGCRKGRGATIRKITNTVGTGSNSVSGTPISYAVDAVIIVRFPDDSFAYNVDIDSVNIDALTANNAYGIYAPRISQSRIHNGYMSGVRTGIYSTNAWLCSIENMNVACGNPSAPTTITAGTVAYNIQTGTSLFMQDCWARITETGYKFNVLSYSSMASCACDYFSLTAYDITGSTVALNGCGAESNVGTAATLLNLSNARVVVNAMQTAGLANMAYFVKLAGSEAQFHQSRIDNTTAGVGTTFYLRSSSTLYVDGRLYPTNTATVYDYDSGSQIIVRDRDNGVIHRFWDTAANANNWGTPAGKVVWGTTTPRGTLYGTTTPKLSLEGTGFGTSIFSLIGNNTGTGNPGEVALGKTRSSTVGGVTLVSNGDTLGTLSFHGGDGSVMALGATISSVVDGAAAAGDMPSRLSLSTRPVGGSLTERLRITAAGAVRPGADNAQTLGDASFRWSTVYAATGAINTSDEREKQQVQDVEAAALRAVRRIQFKQFKFNDAIERKGDGARWHFGVIAQQVKEAFEAEGLDAFAYGLLCYDEWPEQPEVTDDEGNIVTPYRASGNRYGVRYDELLVLKMAAMEAGQTEPQPTI